MIVENIVASNEGLNRAEFAAKSEICQSRPSQLRIEVSTVCNLRCVMCLLAVDKVQRPAYLPVPLMEKLGAWFKFVRELHLVGVGEPILSPALWKAFEWTPSLNDTIIHLFTNGLLLDDAKIDQILESNVSLLNFSCDAATEATYKKIRNGDFHRLIANIKRLRERRDAAQKNKPAVSMNMTLMRENISELPDFIDLAASLGVEVVSFWPMSAPSPDYKHWILQRDGWEFNYEEQGLDHIPKQSNQMVREALSRLKKTKLKHYLDSTIRITFPDEASPAAEPKPPLETQAPQEALAQAPESVTVRDCMRPWSELMVLSSGVAKACWFQADEPGLGNLKDQDLDSIWNGQTAQELRRYLSSGRIHPLCSTAQCIYVAGSKKELGRSDGTSH